MAESPTSRSSAASTTTEYTLVCALLLLIAYWFYPTLKEVALICWNDDDYSHGLLLPLVGAYMLWDRKQVLVEKITDAGKRLRNKDSRELSYLWGFILLGLGSAIFILGQVSGLLYGTWVAFFPVVLGAITLAFGRTVALSLAPAVLILFMARPLPDSITVRLFWPLQVYAAEVSAAVLELLDVPVYHSGNIIEIPSMKLLVEEACSGMRSVMALLTLALIVNYFIKLKFISRIALVVAALLVAIGLNVFRVAVTGLLAHFYDPETATGFFHTFSGLIVFLIGLPLLYYIGVLLMKIDGSKQRI